MIHFWSDTHFNHSGILHFCTRGDADVDKMNARLIQMVNERVALRDDLYILGDFGFNFKLGSEQPGSPLETIFHQLNGRKHLVVGNHDEKNPQVLKLPWESTSHIKVVKHNHQRVVLCHYPIESWPGAFDGVVHLHGHSHGSLKHKMKRRYDVGVDALGVDGPLSWDEVWALAEAEGKFEPVDHHGDL